MPKRTPLRHTLPAAAVLAGAGAGLWALAAPPADTTPRSFLDPLSLTKTIDGEIANAWRGAKIADPKPADDAEFLRRLSLDLNGVIPPRTEVVAFLQDKSRNKRAKKIDELIERPAYAEHIARTWTNLLVGRTYREQFFRREPFYDWIEKAFAANEPYDEMVRELLTAKGVNDENAAVNYFIRYAKDMNPADVAGPVARTFLGVQIQCAQCHNHPYEHWTQEDFWAFAAFFSCIRPRPIKMDGAMPKDYKLDLLDARAGEVYLPDSDPRRPVYPRFLGTPWPEPQPFLNRREALAKWMTSAENPTFAKALVNRVWALLIGRGIVEPIDDFSKKNVPSHPALLEALAAGFVRSGFDIRYLIRAICNSRVYQLASGVQAKDADEEKLFAHAQLKPMTPEQLFYTLLQLGGMDRKNLRADRKQIDRQRDQYLRQFITLFGNEEMQE